MKQSLHYICPVCNKDAPLLDVVDFNRTCLEHLQGKLQLSGRPVYYAMCKECDHCFAPEFQSWSASTYQSLIYNDDYAQFDPDYLERRPHSNAQLLVQHFGSAHRHIRHLDFGGGEGLLSQLLTTHGWQSQCYDPYGGASEAPKNQQFDLITAFEVFEHVAHPHDLMERLLGLLDSQGVILFSTLLSDTHIARNQRLTWWYAAPRNGHISLFSSKSLSYLAQRHGLRYGRAPGGLHAFFKQLPAWLTTPPAASAASLPTPHTASA